MRALIRRIALPVALLALAGCGGEQHADLREFVKKSDDLPHGRIPPLPEMQPYEPFTYNAYDLTDPFKPRQIQAPKAAAIAGGIRPPDPNRRKEPLEAYPLENLKMVGTLQQKKEIFALVRTPDNRLFRVKPGSYTVSATLTDQPGSGERSATFSPPVSGQKRVVIQFPVQPNK